MGMTFTEIIEVVVFEIITDGLDFLRENDSFGCSWQVCGTAHNSDSRVENGHEKWTLYDLQHQYVQE